MTIESYQYHSSIAEAWTSQGSNCCIGSRSSQDLPLKASQISVLNADSVWIQSMLEPLVPSRSKLFNQIVCVVWIHYVLWSQLMIQTRTWSGVGYSLIDTGLTGVPEQWMPQHLTLDTASHLTIGLRSDTKNWGQDTRQVTNSPVWGGSAAFPTCKGRLVLLLIYLDVHMTHARVL